VSERSRDRTARPPLDSLADVLAIPYVLDVSTREAENGEWVCRLEYPELDGCVAESRNALDAYEQVESLREQWLRHRLAVGGCIPTPRPSPRHP
jgi:hypothetical protein